jgi:hypothetical protein
MSRFFRVSIRVSPFLTLLAEADMLITSAERNFPAFSKEERVLVDGSKKRFTTHFPRRTENFFLPSRRALFTWQEREYISSKSYLLTSSAEIKCFISPSFSEVAL